MKTVEQAIAMKEGMRRLASGVSVIAAKDVAGNPYAMTATSVTSVSDSPASLLVCVNKDARMFEAIAEGGCFSVSLLRQNQSEVSNRCASGDQGISRFEVGDWSEHNALPYLSGGLATFFCRQDKAVDYGTHRIVIGVIDEVMADIEGAIDPLVYLNGGYC